MIRTVPSLLLALASFLCLTSETSMAQEDSLSPGFRFVGNYRFDKRMKIRDGASFNVRSKAFFCRVYTDGIAVRVYGESSTEAYTSFTIHRNDGILILAMIANRMSEIRSLCLVLMLPVARQMPRDFGTSPGAGGGLWSLMWVERTGTTPVLAQ